MPHSSRCHFEWERRFLAAAYAAISSTSVTVLRLGAGRERTLGPKRRGIYAAALFLAISSRNVNLCSSAEYTISPTNGTGAGIEVGADFGAEVVTGVNIRGRTWNRRRGVKNRSSLRSLQRCCSHLVLRCRASSARQHFSSVRKDISNSPGESIKTESARRDLRRGLRKRFTWLKN